VTRSLLDRARPAEAHALVERPGGGDAVFTSAIGFLERVEEEGVRS